MLAPWKKSYYKPRQHITKQRHHFAAQGSCNQSCGFSCSQVQMWELDHREGWALKNWCFLTVMLEKTLDSSLNCKIKPVHLKGNQSWILIGRTYTKVEAPILWPLDVKSQLIEKDSDAGKDWGQEKGAAKDEMIRDNITDSVDVNLSKLWETVKDREACVLQFIGSQSWKWLSNWTTTENNLSTRCKS